MSVNKIKILDVKLITFLTSLLLFVSIVNLSAQNKSLINTAHLDHLFEKINVNGEEMGIIHIYANYPDYKYADAPGEGIACVDDAARAEIFYLKYYKITHDKKALEKAKLITRFLIHMQAKNGFFYNFIWKDHSIDSTYKTSVAEPNWWSWRAIWTLAAAQNFFSKNDANLANQIKPVLKKSIKVTQKWLNKNFDNSFIKVEGLKIPSWLPYKYAADQSAILVKAFVQYYKSAKVKSIKKDIIKLCDGIIKMQAGNKKQEPYYALLSWKNTWHQWGNSQADALIDAGKLFGKTYYIKHAEKEIRNFYPFLMKKDYFNNFSVEKKNGKLQVKDVKKFSQIAYGIRPMVFASLNAYLVSKDKESAKIAGESACWLLGKNIAKIKMYHPETGVCYDGIISDSEVNKNSGAESTIEALLSILEVEQNPIAKKQLLDYYENNRK